MYLALLLALIRPWQISAAEETYLLSLSAARPPCMETRATASETSGSRCYGTQPAVTRLERPSTKQKVSNKVALAPGAVRLCSLIRGS